MATCATINATAYSAAAGNEVSRIVLADDDELPSRIHESDGPFVPAEKSEQLDTTPMPLRTPAVVEIATAALEVS
ncbi:unnamed protein product [Heligmosomoides polygyrus]|uniref:Lipoprotein n=1 Tax=Heligmosomoides polygyrus TaxID=6339 RepID=A0A183G1Y1_HELPZ|nr:unnamed protein product [Heligmosomoides polygyrus]